MGFHAFTSTCASAAHRVWHRAASLPSSCNSGLRLSLQAATPRAVVTSRQLQPSESRSAPAVIELCMSVPANFLHISLTVQFSKAFLTVFEHTPDAARCGKDR